MTDITSYMSGDHKRCDDLFVVLESAVDEADWEAAGRELEAFLHGMERHFELEEGTLFPAFEQATGMVQGPTQIMRAEHVQMRGLFTEIRQAFDQKDAEGLLGLTETLLIIMQQHNMKEEQVIYPIADQALGDAAAELLVRLKAVPE